MNAFTCWIPNSPYVGNQYAAAKRMIEVRLGEISSCIVCFSGFLAPEIHVAIPRFTAAAVEAGSGRGFCDFAGH